MQYISMENYQFKYSAATNQIQIILTLFANCCQWTQPVLLLNGPISQLDPGHYRTRHEKENEKVKQKSLVTNELDGRTAFLSLPGFTLTNTDDSQDNTRMQGTIFIPLYHSHPLADIQTTVNNLLIAQGSAKCPVQISAQSWGGEISYKRPVGIGR